MAYAPQVYLAPGQLTPGSIEEDPVPSLPNFEDIFRSFGPRSNNGHKTASIISADDSLSGDIYANQKRQRRLSTATTTSIGRPRHLTRAARPHHQSHNSRDAVTFVKDTGIRELSAFLWTNQPPQNSWVAVPEERQFPTKKKRHWYSRKKANLDKQVLQLPDCAVASKTPNGVWHIAIHIPIFKDQEASSKEPRVKEIDDFDKMSIISRRFSRTGTSKKASRLQRRGSVTTIATQKEETSKKLTKEPPSRAPQSSKQQPSTPMLQKLFSSSIGDETNQRPTTAKTLKAPTVKAADLPIATAASKTSSTVNDLMAGDTVANTKRQDDDNTDVYSQAEFHDTDVTYRQAQVTEYVRPKRSSIKLSHLPRFQSESSDDRGEPFPDFMSTSHADDSLITLTGAPNALKTTAPQTAAASSIIRADRSPFEKARTEARQALDKAQQEEKDAKAVVSKAEQDAKDTIPALEASTKAARSILQESKAIAARAMEDADVEGAVAAARQAAEAQAAIMSAERQISATKIQLEMLLSAANARLVEAQATAQTASKELQMIAIAEAKAEQERLEAERREQERLAAERKAEQERFAKERAEALAAAEAKALADVRAAFAKADEDAAAAEQAAEAEAESQRQASRAAQAAQALAETTLVVKDEPIEASPVPMPTQDPEVREMALRLKKMEESNQMMMQTLSTIARMGQGFEELTKVLAVNDISRSDSGIVLQSQGKLAAADTKDGKQMTAA